MKQHQVVIVGAGPSGLAAAFFLAREGIDVLVLERGPGIVDDPRAATLHPPTLEIFAPSGVTEDILEQGIVARYWQFRGRNEGLLALFDLDLLRDDTPYPYRVQCEQHRLARILLGRLQQYSNFEIRWNCEVTGVAQDRHGVDVALTDGCIRSDYLIGADGGRSNVRKSQDIAFEGFTYPDRFLVVTSSHDFEEDGYCYSNYISDPDQWAAVFKVPGPRPPGIWRFTSPARPEETEADLLDFATAKRRLVKLNPRAEHAEILHTNLYVVHQRVAATFHRERVLLIGDAAHINNPLGGMGMNFGIHDAASVANQLTAVFAGGDPEALLSLYDRQRHHVAHAYLQSMSIQNKAVLEERDPACRAERLEEMRSISEDPKRARAHLMRTSMLESLRAAASIY
ncbi:MAG: 3-(3-hydroxy-phenyl)propionate hydroxylase [Halieaceae bacterium]|jgi:3-(3-hydroxy-phenyl)propionate hydroxylase